MKPHAEIEEVWPRDGRIRLVGRLVGAVSQGFAEPGGSDGWHLLLVRRGGDGRRLRYAARVEDERFEGSVPVADLAAPDLAASAPATAVPATTDSTGVDSAGAEEWDVHLTDGTARLRAGRRLDDIRGKKHILVYPEQRVLGVSVRPYFTVKDNLSLECRGGRTGAAR
ncbi:hypothetical protein ACFY93_06345 [Streptomyces sp. NPDC008313]|uniref:hypothetical protein n=1 Tax=Streptomyces sp. NPDC008313 TaxID=3364826 RepID=UPI0036EB8B3A